MSLFDRLFAAAYDPVMSHADKRFLGELRDRQIERADGEVLEIGAGTGLNVSRYRAPTRVVLTEPEPAMLERLRRRLPDAQVPMEAQEASAEALPFPDDSFDTVVSTLVLCTVPRPELALSEVRRVLRDKGHFVFLEHGGADDERLARWQRRLTPAWRRLAGGCRLTRNVEQLATEAGFDVTELETLMPRGTGPAKPFRLGVAA